MRMHIKFDSITEPELRIVLRNYHGGRVTLNGPECYAVECDSINLYVAEDLLIEIRQYQSQMQAADH